MLGDAPALERLIESYYDAIYAFCCRRVGDAELGADLCQNTFVKMVKSLPSYREQGRFKSWLFTIAANLCRDAFRTKKIAAPLDDNLPDTRLHFEEGLENAELLKSALAQLPSAQQEVVLLRYYHGFSTADIARVLRVPLPTAKTRLHRAIKKLKEILGGVDLER
jgi:RNA polymerase sigma-70 factor (ECF subfamily)